MGEQISLAALCTLIGMGVGVLGFARTGKRDIREDTTQIIRMESKIDNIGNGVDNIRLDIKEHSREFITVNDRLTRCEESAKSGHKRLDEHLQLHDEKI